MVNSADEPPLSSRLYSWAKSKATVPLHLLQTSKKDPTSNTVNTLPQHVGHTILQSAASDTSTGNAIHRQDTNQQGAPVLDKKDEGTTSSTITQSDGSKKPPLKDRFVHDVKRIIRASWINWLLLIVPVAIILGAIQDWGGHHIVSPAVIFALNALAIIPLASMLAYATENVAVRLGDTIGALLNVTFGNAVEIIVFVIALVAGEVRIVQAAALGSILSNLLLILGMGFVLGGLRYREQLYNASVSQMSACLVSLSVISLLLPTAFHAAFDDSDLADRVVLKVSRGTSVVLLLVYIMYLLFQLKSHAFMYQSTPQHVIDEESHPGVLAQILDASSSSSDGSSSSSSDSDSSQTTAKRFRRALRRKRRKSSSSTKDNASLPSFTRTQTLVNASNETALSGDEADSEVRTRKLSTRNEVQSQDFETSGQNSNIEKKKRHKKTKKTKHVKIDQFDEKAEVAKHEHTNVQSTAPVIEVSPAQEIQSIPAEPSARRAFHLRNLSTAVKPAFNSTVFPHHQACGRPLAVPVMKPQVSRSVSSPAPLRRTSSMPDMVRHISTVSNNYAPNSQLVPRDAVIEIPVEDVWTPNEHLSKTSSVVLLLCTTGLVALCAEFLVGSIDYMVASSGLSQMFIGLIILPIVGNAAEHVTAVTVAYKNKMDLAINIALGSSIQIALFVTPLMVMLGWAIGAEMSLYFTLFETVSLFASAFIVNYLMIDGRSNYLEGALLIAVYVIIAIAAFFYPQ